MKIFPAPSSTTGDPAQGARLDALELDLSAQGRRLGSLEQPTTKGRRMEGFKWYRALRLNNVPNDPQSAGEGTSVVFELDCQTDFGNTASRQTSRVFGSFGVRGGNPGAADLGIVPVLTSWGDCRLSPQAESIGLRVYRNDDGFFWLYIRTAVYSANRIRYYIPNQDAESDPFEEVGTIAHDGTRWVIPTPAGSGTLIWDAATADSYQPLIIGKGAALTSRDSAGLAVAGPAGPQALLAGIPARLALAQVYDDATGRVDPVTHAYNPHTHWRGNSELDVAVYDYVAELLTQSESGGTLNCYLQRAGLYAPRPQTAPLRPGLDRVVIQGSISNDPYRPMWLDLSCDADATVLVGSALTIKRGYGQ